MQTGYQYLYCHPVTPENLLWCHFRNMHVRNACPKVEDGEVWEKKPKLYATRFMHIGIKLHTDRTKAKETINAFTCIDDFSKLR